MRNRTNWTVYSRMGISMYSLTIFAVKQEDLHS